MRAREFIIEGYKEVAQKYIASGADQSQVKTAIDKFKEIVNKNQASGDERNIDWWGKNKSFDEFNKFTKSIDLERTKTQVKRQKIAGNSINIFENDNWLVVIPLDKDASCFHGKNTAWCTAKPNQNYFHKYFAKGVTLIYCINKETGDKWAIAASPKYDDKMELFGKNGENLTKKQFQQQTGMNPIDLVELAANHDTSIKQGRKNSTMHDPENAYEYARDVIKGRWPEAEKAIASNPIFAYWYALDVIKGRWPEAEKAIASDPISASHYARDVFGRRWPEAEKVIASNPQRAYAYARDVIKGRWPEVEKVIASNPRRAYAYARDVIKGRWPEAEKVIASDPESAYEYARDVIKGRWPEAEKVIASDPTWAYYYARDVLEDPNSNDWSERYLAGKTK